ncbi:MAG: parallel beta-helix domain-containing protein [Acidobacteriota bacterium]|nr:parallel beta-helix domain-containing protein [Acidobacteriota bacterium]
MKQLSPIALVCIVALAGCQGGGYEDAGPVVLQPDENAQETVQTALLTAQPGDVIELTEGTFEFTGSLSLDVADVTIRGQGVDKTILDFAAQQAGAGAEGITVTSDGFVIEDLTVLNTKGDGIKVEGTDRATFRTIKVDWSGPPKTENGAYGIYPVQVSNVLIEDSQVRGSSDAGIYVGQSRNIIVRGNRVWQNVAGIEIENSFGADVYDNLATNNTGGILVFSLPEMPVKNGRDTRVFRNTIENNNHANFGKAGSIIAALPTGTGLQVMANENVEVFDNDLRDNQTYNIAVLSYLVTEREYDDAEYDPYVEGVYIHDNRFSGGGDSPQGRGERLSKQFGGTFPDIVYDGFVDPAKMVDGELPPHLGIYVENNGDADFVNLDLGAMLAGKEPKPYNDLAAHAGSLPEPPAEIVLAPAGATGAGL